MSHKYTPRRPDNAWVLVADRARARLFSTAWPPNGACVEVEDLIDDEAMLHDRDTGSDVPGAFVSGAGARHRSVPATDFHHRTAERFARRIVERLEDGRRRDQFGQLVLVAPALMLGVLREELSPPLAKLVVEELDRDYTHLTPGDLLKRIAAKGTALAES